MGGNAFAKTQPIPIDRIPGTLKIVTKRIGEFKYKTLGSTGKKPLSGDIDLAVPSDDWTMESLSAVLIKAMGPDNVKVQNQFNQIYTRVPISGIKHKFCQVDFMIGDPDLLSFTHWAPEAGTSQYSGSHRTEYLKAIAKAQSITATRNGRIVARVGYTLFHERGLVYNARWCPPRKDGKGFTATMEDVKPDDILEFNKEFPELLFMRSTVETNPDQICRDILGFGVTPSKVNSYESTAAVVSANPSLSSRADLIWELYIRRLDELHLPRPERIV
jgi:hypothetical protein